MVANCAKIWYPKKNAGWPYVRFLTVHLLDANIIMIMVQPSIAD